MHSVGGPKYGIDRTHRCKKDKDFPLWVPPCFFDMARRVDMGHAYFLTPQPMKKARFFSIIAGQMTAYPLRSQELEDAPVFAVKLFNAF